jgi:hypothetical protein
MDITPVRDTHGKVTHFIATKQDVTERKSLLPESGAFREPEGYCDAGMTMVTCHFCGFGIT